MSIVRLYPSGKEVECQPGDTVLSALEKGGYALPNNCRAGACGECKIKVREGAYDQGFIMDMALSKSEREEGYGLMCMAKPTDDLMEIEWGTDDAQPKLFPPRENVWYTVVDRIPRTPVMVELRLRPIGNPLRFWPGQFLLLGDERDGAPKRSYSIANAPNSDDEIHLLITRVPEGKTSNWVHDKLQLGDRVVIDGPYGTFIGDPSTDSPVLCMASGSGLAPILSLSEAALRRGYKGDVTLLFSARTELDVVHRGLMAFWESRYRNFKFKYTLTQEQGGQLNGRIPGLLPELFPTLSNHSVYVAGNPAFVDDCILAAQGLDADPQLIHSEGYFDQYVPDAPPADRLMA